MLRNLPSVGHIAGQAATGCILHDQSQVRLCEHCFKGIDDVDMPPPQDSPESAAMLETYHSHIPACKRVTTPCTGLRCSCLLILPLSI